MSQDVKETLALMGKHLLACRRVGKKPEINVESWIKAVAAARERIQELEDELSRGRAA